MAAQDYTIDLTNGVVVGDQQFGNQVHLYAHPAPAGHVFSGWVGPAADKLALADEWHTTFVAASSDGTSFELSATYDSLRQVAFEETTFPGFTQDSTAGVAATFRRVFYASPAPQSLKAFVFMIHGTNGSAADWSEQYEQQAVRKDLVYNGYAVFAIDANETVVGDQNGDGAERWLVSGSKTDTSSNIDLKNLVALERYAKQNFGDEPIFMYGGSNGANFADVSAAMLDYTGVCHMIANGNTWLYNQTMVDLKPAIWIQSRNDQNASSDSLVAKANYQSLVDRGLQTQWFWLDKSPAYPTRFQRSLDRITATQSTRIYGDLLAANYIDADGYVTINRIKTELDTASFFSNAPFSEIQKSEILNQLEILNAEHTPHSEYSNQVIRFFDSLLPDVSSIDENHVPLRLTAFPNPTSDFILLQFEKKSTYTFTLLNAIGEQINKNINSGKSAELSLEPYAPGIYYLLVKNLENGETATLKVIKK